MQAGIESDYSERLRCPACSNVMAREAWAGGQRLARCRSCGNLVRRVTERPWPWPVVAASPATEPPNFEWGNSTATADYSRSTPAPPSLQVAASYPPLALLCPHCEYVNRDTSAAQQFCGNCGANLKKTCIGCSAPIAVMDYFCNRCGSDQEQAKLQVEAFYWQRYNEGKRQAQAGNWEAVRRELGLFLDTRSTDEYDPLEARRARQMYATAIAPRDNGEGVRLYNEAVNQLLKARSGRRRQKKYRKISPKIILLGFLLIPGLLLAGVYGSLWLAVAVPLAIILLIFLVVVTLGGLGLG